jgi:hypothetical protein
MVVEAQAAVNHYQERWWEADLYRLKGELTLNQSDRHNPSSEDQKAAEDHFRQTLNIASRQSANLLNCA